MFTTVVGVAATGLGIGGILVDVEYFLPIGWVLVGRL